MNPLAKSIVDLLGIKAITGILVGALFVTAFVACSLFETYYSSAPSLATQQADRQEASQQKAAATRANRIAKAEISDVMKVSDRINAAGREQFLHRVGVSEDGYHLLVTVDGDIWDGLSAQESSMLRQVLYETFAKSYRLHHSAEATATAPVVHILNLAGDTLADDY